MKKIKIATIVGTRPELIRLSRVIALLDESPVIDHLLIHTGQNYDYELNQIFFDNLSIRKPDHFLEANVGSAMKTIADIFIKTEEIFNSQKIDGILILGDTNSCLSAIPAKKHNIPIFHMEAGNRCFDQRVPEEVNRKIVDHIADINLPYSTISRDYLINEGIPADRIIKTGSPMKEVLTFYRTKIEESDILSRLNIEKNKYFLVSAHRHENIENEYNFDNLLKSLDLLATTYKLPIIVSTHPRTRSKINKSNYINNELIHFLQPLGFFDYNNLQINSLVVLSDSGTISEESSILNFKALNLREAHERPEAMEEAAVMMVGLNPNYVSLAVKQSIWEKQNLNIHMSKVFDYEVPMVSQKVLRIILSYLNYVNEKVYFKHSDF